MAMDEGHSEVMAARIEAGADVDSRAGDGRSFERSVHVPLDVAAHDGHSEVVEAAV